MSLEKIVNTDPTLSHKAQELLGQLGSNGSELEGTIQAKESNYSTHVLLTDYFQIDEASAEQVTAVVAEARVRITVEGATSIGDMTTEADDEVPAINRIYFRPGGTIYLDACMVNAFAKMLSEGLIYTHDRKTTLEDTLRIASIYEIGRFAASSTLGLILDRLHQQKKSPPDSLQDGLEFYHRLGNEFMLRDIEGNWTEVDYSGHARTTYERFLRPERFYTRGGVVAVKAVMPKLPFERLLRNYRKQIYDKSFDHPNWASNRQFPDLQDIAAVSPLGIGTFREFCSALLEKDDTVVPFRTDTTA